MGKCLKTRFHRLILFRLSWTPDWVRVPRRETPVTCPAWTGPGVPSITSRHPQALPAYKYSGENGTTTQAELALRKAIVDPGGPIGSQFPNGSLRAVSVP